MALAGTAGPGSLWPRDRRATGAGPGSLPPPANNVTKPPAARGLGDLCTILVHMWSARLGETGFVTLYAGVDGFPVGSGGAPPGPEPA